MKIDLSVLPSFSWDDLELAIEFLEIINSPDHPDVKLWKSTVAVIDVELGSR